MTRPCALGILGIALSAICLGQSQPLFTYDTVKVADRIYAFVAHQPGDVLFSGNSVAVIGDDGVLVVDSGQFPSLTRKMISQIKAWTNKPVRVLVNTHWHGDHNTGNALYQQEFPGVAIVSTPETRAHFVDLREKFLARKQIAGFLPVVKTALDTGKGESGKPLAPATREYFQQIMPELDFAMSELSDVQSVVPNLTFENKLAFYLGDREVDVLFLGRGNTAGDAVIYVPDSKVLITGDLVVSPIPFAHGSFISEWIATLNRLQSMDAAVIIPGHGEILHDETYLRLVADALASVQAQAQQAVQGNLTRDEALRNLNLQQLRDRFTRNDPTLNQRFQEQFLVPAFRRAYREAKEGRLQDEDF